MVDYDQRTALIVVDVQNDFADPKGSLYVHAGQDILPVVNAEIERALAANATDYCVKETALDARRLGFTTTVLESAIRAVDLEEGDGARAVTAMRDAGAEFS